VQLPLLWYSKRKRRSGLFFWQAELRPGVSKGTIRWEELETFQHRKVLFSLPALAAMLLIGQSNRQPFDVVALGDNGQRLRSRSYIFPEYFTDWLRSSIVVISLQLDREKSGSAAFFLLSAFTRDHES